MNWIILGETAILLSKIRTNERIQEGRKYFSISFYTVSSVLLNVVNLFGGVLVYKWVDPIYMGIWQSFILFEIYCGFVKLGTINGMNRELPYNLGKGNKEIAIKYAETAQYYTLLNIIILPVLFLSIFTSVDTDKIAWSQVACFLVIAISNVYNSYLTGTFRASSDFNKLSSIQLIITLVKLFSLPLVYYFSFNGFCTRELLAALVLTGLTFNYRPLKIKPVFDFEILKSLIKTGFPIFIGSYLFGVFNSIPRMILLKYGSFELLGLYAPVMTVIGAMAVIPDSISSYFYPKMSYNLGNNGKRGSIWKTSLRVHLSLLLIAVPIVIVGTYLVPIAIKDFLPKYAQAQDVIILGFIIGIFVSYKFGYTALSSMKSWKLMTVYVLSFGVLQYITPLIMLRYFTPLLAVTYSQLSTSIIMFFISLLTNYYATKEKNN